MKYLYRYECSTVTKLGKLLHFLALDSCFSRVMPKVAWVECQGNSSNTVKSEVGSTHGLSFSNALLNSPFFVWLLTYKEITFSYSFLHLEIVSVTSWVGYMFHDFVTVWKMSCSWLRPSDHLNMESCRVRAQATFSRDFKVLTPSVQTNLNMITRQCCDAWSFKPSLNIPPEMFEKRHFSNAPKL